MEQVYLHIPNMRYMESYFDFISECSEDIKKTGFEFCIPISNGESFEDDINKLISMSEGRNLPKGWVPASVYWLTNDVHKIIGVIVIRHMLTKRLKFRGGHIAYYVRPSQRNKGYGSKMLSLALKHCERLNIFQVLITCMKSNISSANVIIANEGVLDSEDMDNGEVFQRYYIKIS